MKTMLQRQNNITQKHYLWAFTKQESLEPVWGCA